MQHVGRPAVPPLTGIPAASAPTFRTRASSSRRTWRGIERDFIAEALRRCNGVRTKAADLLGMSFRSFRYYAKKYEL